MYASDERVQARFTSKNSLLTSNTLNLLQRYRFLRYNIVSVYSYDFTNILCKKNLYKMNKTSILRVLVS